MFDIGAGEVLVLLLAALFVFGPDRLPTIARQAGRWVNDLRAMVANARRDLTDNLGVDEKDLSSLRDLDPRRYVRQNVLDGLDLDDDGAPARRPKPAKPRNGTAPVRDSAPPPATAPEASAGGGAATAGSGGVTAAPPPYDPDTT